MGNAWISRLFCVLGNKVSGVYLSGIVLILLASDTEEKIVSSDKWKQMNHMLHVLCYFNCCWSPVGLADLSQNFMGLIHQNGAFLELNYLFSTLLNGRMKTLQDNFCPISCSYLSLIWNHYRSKIMFPLLPWSQISSTGFHLLTPSQLILSLLLLHLPPTTV